MLYQRGHRITLGIYATWIAVGYGLRLLVGRDEDEGLIPGG
jgi:hypothetical protein